MAVFFRVQHLDHSGGVISTHIPVGGSLAWSFQANAVGDIAYQLAQSELEELQLPADSFAPYRTDWRLQQRVDTGPWTSIAGGIHVPVNIVSDQDAVNVAGLDWAHWLDQPVWFNYYNYNWDQAGDPEVTRKRDIILANRNAPAGIYDTIALLAFKSPATQAQAITKLIEKTKRGTDYVNIIPVFNGGAGSDAVIITGLMINFQDQTTVLQHINTIASMDSPYGFDWTMNYNKRMEFFGPRKNVASSPTPLWTITKDSILEQPILDLDWTNNGPIATHVVGTSNGSPGLWWHKRDQQSIDKFRLWLKLENVGDQYIKGPEMRYAVDGLQYIHPQKDIKITVLPEVLDPFNGFKNQVGEVVRIKWDFPPYHEVNAYYWITAQSFSGDAAGNFKCELGLQQIYD